MASQYSIKDILQMYKKWVIENPNRATEMETLSKWLSYFLAGRINKSALFSEFIYASSNLFTLYNDVIIRKSQNSDEYLKDTFKNRLKLWLTVLHYCEVFVEITSRHKWGNKAKWSAATVIQIIRCLSNLILICKYTEFPVSQPPIPVLQRKNFEDKNEFPSQGFVLKRSGRVIRRVEAAPPIAFRDWKPLDQLNTLPQINLNNGDINKKKIAEIIYTIKPLIHLSTIACFGSHCWKQWLTYLILDLSSLHLYDKEIHSLSSEQRLEINRRKFNLLFYLLRTPMYQKHTGSVLNRFLQNLSKNIPFAGVICDPISLCLSFWQDTYFYMWPY